MKASPEMLQFLVWFAEVDLPTVDRPALDEVRARISAFLKDPESLAESSLLINSLVSPRALKMPKKEIVELQRQTKSLLLKSALSKATFDRQQRREVRPGLVPTGNTNESDLWRGLRMSSGSIPEITFRHLKLGCAKVPGLRAFVFVNGNLPDVFLYQVIALIAREPADAILRCPASPCRNLFVRIGRKKYCSATCRRRNYAREDRRLDRVLPEDGG